MNIDRFSRLLKRSTLTVSLFVASLLLAACGGSDNDSSSSSSSMTSSSSSSSSFSSSAGNVEWPEVNVTSTTPRTLAFNWTPVSGATHYKLLKNSDGGSGYVQVGADLLSTNATDSLSVHLHDWVNALYLVEACNASGCDSSSPISTGSAMLAAIGFLKASNTDADDWFGWSLALSADGSTLAVGAPAENSKATGVNGDQADNSSPSSGAVYVFTQIEGIWTQQAYIKASNTEQPSTDATQTLPNDRFGYRVALSADGSRLAVSAMLEDSAARGVNCDQGNYLIMDGNDSNKIKPEQINTGAVYVFTRSEGLWTQEAYVKAPTVWPEDRFGFSLAMSGDGDTLAVGTINEFFNLKGVSSASASASSECAPANTVPTSATSSSSTSTSSSSSSSSVSSSSSSTSSGSAVAANSGAVYVYVRVDGSWAQQVYVKASNTDAGDAFGASVALSHDGATLAVGAPGEDGTATGINGDQTINSIAINNTTFETNGGAVYVFRRAETSWTQQAYVKPAHVSFRLQFGASVALSADGNRLAVGATGDLSKATGINGNAADYEILTTSQAAFNQSSGLAYGAAYVFSYVDSNWRQDAYVKASNADAFDEFGRTVRLSTDGMTLAVGTATEASTAKGVNGDQANNSNNATGAVYVYRSGDSGWSQQAYVKPANTRGGDRFGAAIGISHDGALMAVGAYREPSQATGVNGDREDAAKPSAGAVYLY